MSKVEGNGEQAGERSGTAEAAGTAGKRRMLRPLGEVGQRRYEAGLAGGAAFALARDFVRVEGADAFAYLQGQLSQDLAPMGAGDSVQSLLLSPKGKLVAALRVTRLSADAFVLDGDAGTGPPVVERLTKFKLRSRLDISTVPWRAVALRGGPPGDGGALLAGGVLGSGVVGSDDGGALGISGDGTTGYGARGYMVLPAYWEGVQGVDLVGEAPAAPEGSEQFDVEAAEALRIETGTPRFGAELSEEVIPAEADLVTGYVSFTKGCYTGQELVARIDSRGSNVARRLRGLVFDAAGELDVAPGEELSADGSRAGVLTSVGWCPRLGAFAGLGFVRRAVPPGTRVRVGGGGPWAEVRELPLIS
ncbi:MAG: hypothetical protein M0Z87_09175 [Actinomycetota bacterium]|nr:hypothetical protein [Actinomycetota bacterium]